jgi:hypothetical protein
VWVTQNIVTLRNLRLDCNGDPEGKEWDTVPDAVLSWLLEGLDRLLPHVLSGHNILVHGMEWGETPWDKMWLVR